MRRYASSLLLLLIGAGAGPASADIITLDNSEQTLGVASFGEPPDGLAYYGQSFTALGDQLDELSFFIRPDGPRDSVFRLLITEVTPVSQPDPTLNPTINPTSILYESGILAFAPTGRFEEVFLDLGGVALSVGSTYAFVLDAFTPADGEAGRPATLGANESLYQDGLFFYYAQPQLTGDREDQFADSDHWIADDTGLDLAFRMSFSCKEDDCDDGVVAVPEPGTLALLGAGLIGMGYARRRRKAE